MSSDSHPVETTVSPFRAGLATMLIGAVLLGVGLLQTTSAHVQPSCPAGTELIAKFKYQNGYRFESPHGNADVVTIRHADRKGGSWTSSRPVSAIVVKGGDGSKTATYSSPQTSGSFSNDGLKKERGKTPDISNVQFCGSKHTPTTTTTKPTTTTTKKPTTTTTKKPTTTTTSTTTTAKPTTTTTEPTTTTSTTTTTEPTTTTEATTTTASTTTTVDDTSSTSTSTTAVGDDSTTSTTVDDGDSSTTTTTTVDDDPDVEGRVVVNTSITPDDGAALAASGGSLPRTGAPSVPLVVIGIILLALGGTLSFLNRNRRGASS